MLSNVTVATPVAVLGYPFPHLLIEVLRPRWVIDRLEQHVGVHRLDVSSSVDKPSKRSLLPFRTWSSDNLSILHVRIHRCLGIQIECIHSFDKARDETIGRGVDVGHHVVYNLLRALVDGVRPTKSTNVGINFAITDNIGAGSPSWKYASQNALCSIKQDDSLALGATEVVGDGVHFC